MSGIWIRDHLPKKSSDLLGREKEIDAIKALISRHRKGSKPIFLYGGHGNGKTAAVYALSEDLGLELIEVNASDTRNTAAIESILGGASKQASLFNSGKLILIDEIEGVSGNSDRGAIPAILRVATESRYPVIIVGQDASDDKVKALRKGCELIEFKPVAAETIAKILAEVADKENIKVDKDILDQLGRISGGDVRAAINDLQTVAAGKKEVTSESLKELGNRETVKEIEQALQRVFKTTSPEIALGAFDDVSEDLDKIFLWVEENIPREYLEPKHMAMAFDNLSLANVFFGRIRRWQYYRFYVYCYNLLTAGIALSKDKKYPGNIKYKPTSRLLKIWIYNNANAKKKSISSKVAARTHTSMKAAMHDTVPYLQVIFKKNKSMASELTEYFDLSNEEIDWLRTK